jgi:uncharacterized protein
MNPSEKSNLIHKLDYLIKLLKKLKSIVIAYSGGTDSTLLLKLAKISNVKAIAITADSEIYPRKMINLSKKLTKDIGIEHRIILTKELTIKDFINNTPKRCFFCKDNLFKKLSKILISEGYNYIIDGTNTDDLNDFRPGIKALSKYKIISPFIDANISKKDIRDLSKYLKLPTWNNPPSTCLATRIPYFIEITKEALERIEKSEEFLTSYGFKNIRVRDHAGLARIEVDKNMLNVFLNPYKRRTIYKRLKSYGYHFVSLDLGGYKTGNLNRYSNEQV